MRGGDPDDRALAVEHRPGHVGALVQAGAGLLGLPGDDLVEVHPGANQAVVGERRQLRPGQLQPHATADDAQPVVADPAVLSRRLDADREQLLDRTRRETVSADLLAGKGGLLQQQDVEARLRQVVRGRGAGGAGADDDHVRGVEPGAPRLAGRGSAFT